MLRFLITLSFLAGCTTGSVMRETERIRQECEAAAQRGNDTTEVCRTHLKPKVP